MRTGLVNLGLALLLVLGATSPTAANRDDASGMALPAGPDADYREPMDPRALHGVSSPSLTVSAAAFHSRNDSELYFNVGLGYVTTLATVNSLFVAAPVSLPDGVEVLRLYLYAYDNSLTLTNMHLVRQQFGTTNAAQTMAQASTVSNWPFVQVASDDTVDNAIVDNDTYQYYLWGEIGPNSQRLYAVRITYDDPAATSSPANTSTRAQRARVRPNPFGQQTRVEFSLSGPQAVNVRVYNAAGRVVRTLLSGQLGSGQHVLRWDGRDGSGREVSNGIYYLRVPDSEYELATKLVRLE